MFDTISEEELEKILHKNDFKRGQEGYIQVSEAIKEAQKNFTLKQVIEWGNGKCLHAHYGCLMDKTPTRPRKYCDKCWAELATSSISLNL